MPYRLAAGFPAAAVASCPLVVALTDSWHGDTVLEVHTRLADAGEGRAFLDGLLCRGRVDNPFRGKVLEAAYVVVINDVPPADRIRPKRSPSERTYGRARARSEKPREERRPRWLGPGTVR